MRILFNSLQCSILMALMACHAAAPLQQHLEEPHQRKTADGLIQVSEKSSQFIHIETLSSEFGASVLKANAQVRFQDGAFSQITAPLAGRVVDVHIKSDQRVIQGMPLLTLDCPEAATMRTALATAEAALSEARADALRARRMLQEGVGTEREKIQADVRLAQAEASVREALAAVEFVGRGHGGFVTLRSPIAGRVLTKQVTVGETVQPGSQILIEIGDDKKIGVVAQIFERDLPLIREGAIAHVEFPALNTTVEGHVLSVGAQVSGDIRSTQVRIALKNNNLLLRPGMMARARIDTPDKALSLPIEAVLIKNGDQHIVYVEKRPRTFEAKSVTIGQPLDGRVQILSGLSSGERVVISGALLIDGSADQLL